MGHPVRAREKSPQSQPRSLARGSASTELFPISNSEMTSKWVNPPTPPPPPHESRSYLPCTTPLDSIRRPRELRAGGDGVGLGAGSWATVPGGSADPCLGPATPDAVIFSPEIGVFGCQIDADTLTFGDCLQRNLGLWEPTGL